MVGPPVVQGRAEPKRCAGGPGAERADVVAEMIASLGNVRTGLDAGGPEERKSVVRSFLKSIRVDGAAGRAVLTRFRVPPDVSFELVAVGGIEPPTRGL